MFRLDGKIALVTGAATGLGQAIAAALTQSRANVALTDKTVDALTETESMIKQIPNAFETPTGLWRTSAVTFNYRYMRCAQFGLWQGARRAHTPQWVCNRRATQPQAKFGATLRAAVLQTSDARSLQIHCGICSSLASRLAEKSLAAHVSVIKCHSTSVHCFEQSANQIVGAGRCGAVVAAIANHQSAMTFLDYFGNADTKTDTNW